jgi:hypothetical protein
MTLFNEFPDYMSTMAAEASIPILCGFVGGYWAMITPHDL